MSRKARTRSSLALALLLPLAALLWFATRGAASSGEHPDRLDAKDAVVANTNAPRAKPKAARTTVFPLPTDFKVKLICAGLDPKALCAAGVASGSVLAILQAAADQMNGAPIALDVADEGLATAQNTADALSRKIVSGKATQEEIASYPGATQALNSALAAQQTVLDGYFAAATANLSGAQRAALTNIRGNKSWELATEYTVVNREQADWVALRDALANERIADSLPGTLNQNCQALLATVRADPTVSAARTAVQNSLQTITSAWNTAAGD